MNSEKEVTHIGIVSEVGEKGIDVTIGVIAQCTNCEIKSSCNLAELSYKELYIECDPSLFKKCQRVKVRLKSVSGKNASFLLYFLPFLILIGFLLITSVIIKDETVSVIFSFLSLIPYYILLFLFRKRIKTKFIYEVTPFLGKSI
jgi:positive regulator of sigma E activity